MNKDLSKDILEQIESEKIEPKSKLNFIFKDYFIWFLFGLSIIVGAMAVSVLIHVVKIDYNSFGITKIGFGRKIFMIIPYTWLLCLVVFITVAYYYLKHTKKGYKINPYLIIAISIIVSIVLGVAASFAGTGRVIENSAYQHLPMYDKIHNQKMQLWHDPESGRLMGVIVEKLDNDYYLLDVAKQKWLIHYGEELPLQMRVRLLGDVIAKAEFNVMEHLDPKQGKFRMPICERKEECSRSTR
jgi:hypothetical protein